MKVHALFPGEYNNDIAKNIDEIWKSSPPEPLNQILQNLAQSILG